ncbi:MAG: DsrE/DsrF/DrsH-like family protein [Halothiobacillus sp.]
MRNQQSLVRHGLALILSKGTHDAARTAFSLALTAVAVGDSAGIFFTQGGLNWLRAEGVDPELAELRALCLCDGVLFIACADSLDSSLLTVADLIPQAELAGAARFYLLAREVTVSLYL